MKLNLCASNYKTRDMNVATAKMLTANKGKSRLGASVAIKFSQQFANEVTLPLYSALTMEDVDRVCDGVKKYLSKQAESVSWKQ